MRRSRNHSRSPFPLVMLFALAALFAPQQATAAPSTTGTSDPDGGAGTAQPTVFSIPAASSGTAAGFEIDGNLLCGTGEDWYPGAIGCIGVLDPATCLANPLRQPAIYGRDANWGYGSESSIFNTAYTNQNDDNIAATVDPWRWTSGSFSSSKYDLTEYYAHSRLDTKGDRWLMLAAATRTTDGTAHIDFELNQAGLNRAGTTAGTISGYGPMRGRTIGDLLVSVNTEYGKVYVEVRVWNGTAYVTPAAGEAATITGALYAALNTTTVETKCDATSTSGAKTKQYSAKQFVELALNLSVLKIDFSNLCDGKSSLIVKTRATVKCLGETLKDFAIASFQIGQAPACAITGPSSICAGGEAELCGPTGAKSWLWSTGETTRCIKVRNAGTYTLKTTYEGGCSSNCSHKLDVGSGPAVQATVKSSCAGETLELFATTVPGGVYSWTGPGAFVSNQQNPTIPNAQPGASGRYCVVVTAGGCASPQACVDVVVPVRPGPPIATNGGPVCVGGTIQLNATTIAGASYRWTGPNNFVSTLQNPTVPNATPAAAGQYCVVATIGGCDSPQSCTIADVRPRPIVSVTIPPVCEGERVVLTSNAPAGSTCLWTGPNGFSSTECNPVIASATPAHAGQYCLVVTAGGCPSAPACANLVVKPRPGTKASNNGPVCLGEEIRLFAISVPGGVYRWTGPNGFGSDLQNPVIPNASATNSGEYCVTVTVDGCISLPSCTNVVVKPRPVVTASNGGAVCIGGSIQLTATTIAGASYSWTGPGAYTSSLQNPLIANATLVQSGEYCVTVTVDGCRSLTSCTSVQVKSKPVAVVTSNGPVCEGSTIVLSSGAPAGALCRWNGPNGFTSTECSPTIPNATLAHAGQYCVVVTLDGCESALSCGNVTITPRPGTKASNNGPLCVGAELRLFAIAYDGAIYQWTGPNGFASTLQNPVIPNAQPSNTGRYCVTVTANGCVSLPSCTDVVIKPRPVVIATNGGAVCIGQPVQLNATTIAGATYAWTGPGSYTSTQQNPVIPNAQPTQSGSYCVTVTVDGCVSAQSCTEVLVRPLPVVVATNGGPVCVGGTIQLNASTVAGATYAWTGPNNFVSTLQNPTVPNAQVVSGGQYCVVATVGTCASAPSCTEAIVRPRPAVIATNGGPVCIGGTIQLNATLVTGATYAWTGPNNFTSTLQNPTVPNAQLVNGGPYCVTATLSGCASEPSCTNATVTAPPVVVASSNGPVCAATKLQLSATTIAGATYAWTGPNNFTSAVQNPSIASAQAVNAGEYCVTARLNGCPSAPSCVIVTVKPLPAVVATNGGGVCVGATIQLNASTVTGATYAWTGPNNFNSTLQNPTVPNAQAVNGGQYCVTVTVDGCTSPQSCTTVTVNPLPSCTIKPSSPAICGTTPVTLCGPEDASYDYLWTPGGATSRCITTSTPGIYTLRVTQRVTKCVSTCTYELKAQPPVVCSITPSATACCPGQTVDLCGPTTANLNYLWSTGETTRCIKAGPGTYTLDVTDKTTGCTSKCSVTINALPAPPSTITVSKNPLCEGETARLCVPSGSGLSWLWSTGATTRCIDVKTAGEYSVQVFSKDSECVGASKVVIQVVPRPVSTITGPSSLLAGATGQLCGPIDPNYTYSWNTGAKTQCITVGPGTYTLTVTDIRTNCTSATSFTITGIPCACSVGYPDNSNPPRSLVTFDDQEVLQAKAPVVCPTLDSKVSLWYGGDHPPILGVRRVAVITTKGGPAVETDYLVAPNPAAPGCATDPAVGTTLTSGEQAGTDDHGRPLFPALFITDITDNPTGRAGDWQQGGTAIPPHRVCGQWKSVVRVVDLSGSTPKISMTADPDTPPNNWNLGGGDVPPGGYPSLPNGSWTAQVSWDLNRLPIVPGRIYRMYFMVQEGGSSVDPAQGCVTVYVPIGAAVAANIDSIPSPGTHYESAGGSLGAAVSASPLEPQGVTEFASALPVRFELGQNHPNPFDAGTVIRFSLPQRSSVSLRVYTIQGREVATLVEGSREAGEHSLQWTPRDRTGAPLAPGVYLYRIEAISERRQVFRDVRKMVLLK